MVFGLVAASTSCAFTGAATPGSSGQIYQRISEANIFGLKPVVEGVQVTPADPLPKVILAGFTTLGQRRALLKLQFPAHPPEPARELGCVLGEGEREGPVSVLDIDERSDQVRVEISGTVLVLSLGKHP